jgi:tetratricopeptide (TPR) repeat protein
MIPRIICRTCGNELEQSDKFCAACGSGIEWPAALRVASPEASVDVKLTSPPDSEADRPCPLCGYRNPTSARTCSSCGNLLRSDANVAAPQAKPRSSRSVPQSPALKFLQSWKLTAALAIVLISLVIVFTVTRNGDASMLASAPPAAAEVIKEIDALQAALDKNPNDARAILRLANLLHDVHFYPRAIAMYQKYLQLEPSNADARVDLGISYFELSFADSSNVEENLQLAQQEMERALTYAPKHQLAHYNLGIVQFHAGKTKDAQEWFKKCVAIDPNSEVGKRAQQFLTQHSFTQSSQPRQESTNAQR